MVEPERSYHPLAPDALAALIRLLAGEPITSLQQNHDANGAGEHTGSTVPDALCCLERLINNLGWISPTLDWLLNAVSPSIGRWQQTQPSLWCMPQPRNSVPADVLPTLPALRFGYPGHDILLTTSWYLNGEHGSTDPIIDFGYAFHFDARKNTTQSIVSAVSRRTTVYTNFLTPPQGCLQTLPLGSLEQPEQGQDAKQRTRIEGK